VPDPRETTAVDFLAELGEEERRAAVARINAAVKLKAPIDSVDPPPPVRNLDEYLETEFPTPPFLVKHGQLCRGEITAMVSRAGKGKTTLAQNRLVRWSAGVPLFPEEEESQAPLAALKMLLIENEGTAWHMQQKLNQLANDTADLTPEQRELTGKNLLIWGNGGYSDLKLDREKDLDKVRRACDEYRPDVLYMEPWRKLWSGEENSATEVEVILDIFVNLAAEFECAVLLAHHARKTAAEDGDFMTEARGSVVLEDTVAVMEHFKPVKGGSLRELSWSKSRYAPMQPPLRIAWNPETWRVDLLPEDAVSGAILNLMRESPQALFSVSELAEELDETQAKIRDAITHLLDTERIVKKKVTERGGRGFVYRLKTGESDDTEDTGGLDIT
jgi:hypothetical protein